MKRFISSDELNKKSFQLASSIVKSDFRPNWLIALWRGGAPVGMCVQEFLKHFGINTDHISVRTSSYVGIGMQNKEILVHGLEYVVENANANDRLLIVDDIFDSGRSIEAVLARLGKKMRSNMPKQIRIATVFYKPQNNKTSITPDFFCETTKEWIVFPHELEGLSLDEIKTFNPNAYSLMEGFTGTL